MNHIMISQEVSFDRAMIHRYDRSGPRYTSYPTAPHFSDRFGGKAFRKNIVAATSFQPDRPLSLYIHIPFCDTVCYYCACNKVVTPDRSRAAYYLTYLEKEIALVGSLFDQRRPVVQLHLGGGSPTYLTLDQMGHLLEVVRNHFFLLDDDQGEYGIEVDPREVPRGTVRGLRALGFNRISIGVQDLDPRVQKAVNRIQPQTLNQQVVAEAREAGFQSINLDLIYGLPLQGTDSFLNTLETVVNDLDPDRLAIFN
ncbi:MAG: radical SAM protein, partial [Magnetococcus sp. DMHC-1]